MAALSPRNCEFPNVISSETRELIKNTCIPANPKCDKRSVFTVPGNFTNSVISEMNGFSDTESLEPSHGFPVELGSIFSDFYFELNEEKSAEKEPPILDPISDTSKNVYTSSIECKDVLKKCNLKEEASFDENTENAVPIQQELEPKSCHQKVVVHTKTIQKSVDPFVKICPGFMKENGRRSENANFGSIETVDISPSYDDGLYDGSSTNESNTEHMERYSEGGLIDDIDTTEKDVIEQPSLEEFSKNNRFSPESNGFLSFDSSSKWFTKLEQLLSCVPNLCHNNEHDFLVSYNDRPHSQNHYNNPYLLSEKDFTSISSGYSNLSYMINSFHQPYYTNFYRKEDPSLYKSSRAKNSLNHWSNPSFADDPMGYFADCKINA